MSIRFTPSPFFPVDAAYIHPILDQDWKRRRVPDPQDAAYFNQSTGSSLTLFAYYCCCPTPPMLQEPLLAPGTRHQLHTRLPVTATSRGVYLSPRDDENADIYMQPSGYLNKPSSSCSLECLRCNEATPQAQALKTCATVYSYNPGFPELTQLVSRVCKIPMSTPSILCPASDVLPMSPFTMAPSSHISEADTASSQFSGYV